MLRRSGGFNSTLVRFQGIMQSRLQYIKMFQFHIGSISGFSRLKTSILFSCFNSTLVRFQAVTALCFAYGIPSFNSTLVRFQDSHSGMACQCCKLFQFHIGSISGPKIAEMIVKQSSFNSTLVRFQVNRGIETIKLKLVSIPHWFDFRDRP